MTVAVQVNDGSTMHSLVRALNVKLMLRKCGMMQRSKDLNIDIKKALMGAYVAAIRGHYHMERRSQVYHT